MPNPIMVLNARRIDHAVAALERAVALRRPLPGCVFPGPCARIARELELRSAAPGRTC